jgi:DNA-binding NtrC family response regulator
MRTSGSAQRPVILVVEEEAAERVAIAEHLGEAGFDVLEAGDTDEALALLERRSDVQGLVTDAHLPGRLDGSELARTVRDRRPGIRVVLMSGHSDLRDDEMPDGVEFVSKPYLLDRLAPTLRRLIEAA